MRKDEQNNGYKNPDNNIKTTKDSIDNSHENKSEEKDDKLKRYMVGKKGKTVVSMFFIAIIGVGLGFYVGLNEGRTLPATHKSYTKSQVLATVGDVKITGEDFSKRMEPYFYYQGLNKLSDEEIESYEASIINYMTNLEALYKEGIKSKITATDEEVENNYSTIMSSIESSVNLTEEEFLKKFGLTKDYIKKILKKEIIATKYLQNNSQVSEKEAENYYNNNKEDFFKIRASHILISNYDENGKEVSDKEKEENKALAENLLKRALNGEKFDDLALENSDDTYTASNGGDLGYFSKGQMDENFENAAFSLNTGEIYPKVIETNYGYHIIKKTGEKYSDFDDEKESLMEALSSNKQNTLLQDALEKYNVKINM